VRSARQRLCAVVSHAGIPSAKWPWPRSSWAGTRQSEVAFQEPGDRSKCVSPIRISWNGTAACSARLSNIPD